MKMTFRMDISDLLSQKNIHFIFSFIFGRNYTKKHLFLLDKVKIKL